MTAESTLCRICRVENETVSLILSEYKMIFQNEYKKRYGNVCRYIHWRLCKKHGFEDAPQWYEHEPDGANEIQCNTKIEVRRPDIAVIDKTKKEVKIVDVPYLEMCG